MSALIVCVMTPHYLFAFSLILYLFVCLLLLHPFLSLCAASLSSYAYVSSLYATIPSIAIRCLIKISFTFNDLMSIPLIIIFISAHTQKGGNE